MAERGYTLSKAERLSWKRYIDLLFLRGQSFVAYPLRVVYLPVEGTLSVPVSFLVSVPKKKFKRAVTDSGSEVRFAEDKPGVGNLMTIYSCFTGKSMEEIEREFDGKGYGDFKLAVGEACADGLSKIREEFAKLIADKAHLDEVMKCGAEAAFYHARKTMSKVRRKIGFVS